MDFKSIEILAHNSFFGSKLIAHFLSGCENKKIRLEIIYLLFPFVFNRDARDILARTTKESSLNSAFLDSGRGKIALAGIEKRIERFKSLTQTSLVVASNEFTIRITDNISIEKSLDYARETEPYLREFYRASYYLGKILSKNEIFDLYVKLGIRNIWIATSNK